MSDDKPERFPVAYVEWTDSGTLASGWEARADALTEGDRQYETPIRAAGLLIERDERRIVLAVGWSPNADDLLHAIWIPVVNIRRLDVWNPPLVPPPVPE